MIASEMVVEGGCLWGHFSFQVAPGDPAAGDLVASWGFADRRAPPSANSDPVSVPVEEGSPASDVAGGVQEPPEGGTRRGGGDIGIDPDLPLLSPLSPPRGLSAPVSWVYEPLVVLVAALRGLEEEAGCALLSGRGAWIVLSRQACTGFSMEKHMVSDKVEDNARCPLTGHPCFCFHASPVGEYSLTIIHWITAIRRVSPPGRGCFSL